MFFDETNSIGRDICTCTEHIDFHCTPNIHRHFELFYVKKGLIIIDSSCGQEEINKGEYALILSNKIHAVHTPIHSNIYNIIFSGDLVHPFKKKVTGMVAESTKFKCSKSIDKFLHEQLFLPNEPLEWYSVKASLYSLLGEYRKQVALKKFSSDNEDLLYSILNYVENNFKDGLTLSQIAQALGYEKHYLSRYFHSCIPMNFSRFVNLYKVDAATDMLQNENISITDVAMLSGFQSIRNFNRIYLEMTGRTPLQAAKKLSKNNKA